MNLASVQRILWINPIEGADAIELAGVLGWQVVIKKGEFKTGDLVCYIQIDTVVPRTGQFEFLRERSFRVKTIKLRKQLSQGLITPLPIGRYSEGQDLTEKIGITKYSKPDTNPSVSIKLKPAKTVIGRLIQRFLYSFLYKKFPSLRKQDKAPFPTTLVSITDEGRIQNMPWILTKYKGQSFERSYKLDGSSITIIHEKKFGKTKYRICSRNYELFTETDWSRTFNSTGFSKHIDVLVARYGDNVIVQGEMIGKANGNHHGLKTDEIKIFNIYVNSKRLNPIEFGSVCVELDIPRCPSYGFIKLDHTMAEVLAMSELPDILNDKVHAEGLVWRSLDGKISFKAINNQYLLKEK